MPDGMTDVKLLVEERLRDRAKYTDMSGIGLTSIGAMEGG
jgi:hypothetical protein